MPPGEMETGYIQHFCSLKENRRLETNYKSTSGQVSNKMAFQDGLSKQSHKLVQQGDRAISVDLADAYYPGIQFRLPCTPQDNFSWVPNCLLGPPGWETKVSSKTFWFGLCEIAWFLCQPIANLRRGVCL